jgi:hypothetical protein
MVLRNPALPLDLSFLASRTEQDSRRTRGLKSASLTCAFSANQRKQSDANGLTRIQQYIAVPMLVQGAGLG